MLNLCGYTGLDILKKHVIDNSCGDGAFLCEVVHRYIRAAFACHMSKEEIVFDLSYYIHGIEKDGKAYNDCLYNLSKISDRYHLGYIQWDVLEADALTCNDFKGKMDYVVGNPPYVRVHNLKDTYSIVKHYAFTQEGMTDLYLAFFELGFSMLAPNGRMCYITPSSWLNSVAANYMREYLYKHRNMEALVDLGHFQPFERATAYTLISYFVNDKVKRDTFLYYKYDSASHDKYLVDELPYNESYIDQSFFLSDKQTLHTLHQTQSAKMWGTSFPTQLHDNQTTMLTNKKFLASILDSFKNFIESGTTCSTSIFKPLHGVIAADLATLLGDAYEIKSLGITEDKEAQIKGRYIGKNVDITIIHKATNKVTAGIGVKFVMQNDPPSTISYFEEMLGETANIRSSGTPYFQIHIIPDTRPLFKGSGEIGRWEAFSEHDMTKYCTLAKDNVDFILHTPNKTLLYVVQIHPKANSVQTKTEYFNYYKDLIPKLTIKSADCSYPDFELGGTVIINDYQAFINKVYHTIMAQ